MDESFMNAHADFKKDGLRGKQKRWVKRLGERPADLELAAAAADAVECLTTIPKETIRITARNGWLHLEGTVARRHQQTTLQEVTRHLPGVVGVADHTMIGTVPRKI